MPTWFSIAVTRIFRLAQVLGCGSFTGSVRTEKAGFRFGPRPPPANSPAGITAVATVPLRVVLAMRSPSRLTM